MKINIPKEKPIWFCGDAREWRVASGAARTLGGADGIEHMTHVKNTLLDRTGKVYNLNSLPLDIRTPPGGFLDSVGNKVRPRAPITVDAQIAGVSGGFILGSLGVIFSGGALSFSDAFNAGFAGGIIGSCVGAMIGTFSGLALPGLIYEKVGPWLAQRRGETKEDLLSMGERIGFDRMDEINKATKAAEKLVARDESISKDEKVLLNAVSKGFSKLVELMAEKDMPKKQQVQRQDGMEEIAEAMRKVMPEAFKGDESNFDLAETSILAKLKRMGDLGEDGVAALTIWKTLSSLTDLEIKEREKFTLERLPRLVTAFYDVPESERDKPNEFLGGETPRGSLKRGLVAALDAALTAKARVASSAAVRVEAEARVLEESATTSLKM